MKYFKQLINNFIEEPIVSAVSYGTTIWILVSFVSCAIKGN